MITLVFELDMFGNSEFGGQFENDCRISFRCGLWWNTSIVDATGVSSRVDVVVACIDTGEFIVVRCPIGELFRLPNSILDLEKQTSTLKIHT